MHFFFDRCISHRLLKMVEIWNGDDHFFHHHQDDTRFVQNTPDVEWIRAVAADTPRRIIVSGDCKMRRKKDEVNELRKANLTVFLFADHWTDLTIDDQVWKFFKLWPEIKRCAADTELTPTVFEIRTAKAMKVEKIALTRNL